MCSVMKYGILACLSLVLVVNPLLSLSVSLMSCVRVCLLSGLVMGPLRYAFDSFNRENLELNRVLVRISHIRIRGLK